MAKEINTFVFQSVITVQKRSLSHLVQYIYLQFELLGDVDAGRGRLDRESTATKIFKVQFQIFRKETCMGAFASICRIDDMVFGDEPLGTEV
jgi:hypothetical protein